jgi:general L-amino acid transport system permease protein
LIDPNMTAVSIPESVPPPRTEVGPIGWLRANLFSSVASSLMTIGLGVFLIYVALGLVSWVFTSAEWAVVANNLRTLMLGIYPINQTWRVWTVILIVSFLAGLSWGVWRGILRGVAAGLSATALLLNIFPVGTPTRFYSFAAIGLIVAGFVVARNRDRLRRPVMVLWLIFPFAAVLLLRGLGEDNAFLPLVKYDVWGGLLLTFMLSIIGIVGSFPLGVLLALGRRSKLPIVKTFSVAYIELIRGVPLVTILFMAQVVLPLFLSTSVTFERTVRAAVGIILFSAAYQAENVRGGLQAIPPGQIEAAQALGMNTFLTTALIVLPQALRAVIPASVGQFISLFKDTSLVVIVGLTDLLGAARGILAKPAYLGRQAEVYCFIAIIYWVFSYAMSYASRRLEATLGVGKR